MRKSKFTESQIVGILKEAESRRAGARPAATARREPGVVLPLAAQVCRRLGGRREAAARARGGEREAETDVRRSGPGERGHQGRALPKTVTPSAKRQVLAVLIEEHQLPVQRACRVVRLSRTAYYRPPPPQMRTRRARDRRADGRRGRARPLGLLEVFRSAAARRASVESQARASRVLRAAAESAAADQAARADAAATAAAGAADAE